MENLKEFLEEILAKPSWEREGYIRKALEKISREGAESYIYIPVVWRDMGGAEIQRPVLTDEDDELLEDGYICIYRPEGFSQVPELASVGINRHPEKDFFLVSIDIKIQ